MPRRTQAKAPKDLNAPKKPVSSYILFNKQRMPELRADPSNQGKKITELTKIVGAEWKAMTDEQKQPFVTEAQQNKENFNRQMDEYKQTENYAAFQTKLKNWKISQKENAQMNVDEDERPAVRVKALKRPKDPNAPKKPLTGFFIFQTGRRPQLKELNPEKKHTELVKMASEEWRAMTAEQKEPFEAQAREKKAAYNEQMKAYKESEEYQKHLTELAAWKAAKNASQKQAKKQAPPVRTPTESASGSDDASESEDSSESDRRSPPKRRSFSSDSSDDSGSDVEMGDRNSPPANGYEDEPETDSESESE